jgi:dihydropteroate synthase
VDAETEKSRVLPVVRSLAGNLAGRPDAAVSIDTYKAEVAAEALKAGAKIVNDVSACRFDPALMDVVAGEKPGYVLMHSLGRPAQMQSAPAYDDVVEDVLAFFEERLAALTAAGLPEDNVVLDPGIGFGKTLEHNLALIRGIERFHALGRPLYIGISNKSLWGKLLGLEAEERGPANMAATIYLAERGVAVHRVHDAAAASGALRALAGISSSEAKAGTAGAREGGLHA